MNTNARIARELVRIAKQLAAGSNTYPPYFFGKRHRCEDCNHTAPECDADPMVKRVYQKNAGLFQDPNRTFGISYIVDPDIPKYMQNAAVELIYDDYDYYRQHAEACSELEKFANKFVFVYEATPGSINDVFPRIANGKARELAQSEVAEEPPQRRRKEFDPWKKY